MYLKTNFTTAKMLVPVKSRPEAGGERKEPSLRFPALGERELSNHFVNLGFSFKVFSGGFCLYQHRKMSCHSNIYILIEMLYLFKTTLGEKVK